MSAAVMQFDAREVRERTRWTMGLSVAVHVLLFTWLILQPHAAAQPPLTEIAWLEPGEAGGEEAAPAAAATVQDTQAGVAAANATNEHFRREAHTAEMAPTPQSDDALDDRLNARLAALQGTVTSRVANPVTTTLPNGLWGAPSTVSGQGAGSGPIALKHGGGTGTGTALALTRLGGSGAAEASALIPARVATAAASEPAREGNATAHRELSGASLLGPVADRPILHSMLPQYPEWAKRDAVEGSVTLYFVVRTDGTVKENVLVQKTAGFEDFDDSARTALRAWRFEPLHEGRTGEQWGTITFHFRLRDAG